MRVIPSQVVTQILHNLSRRQCLGFISTLNESLAQVHSEASLPGPEKLIHQPLRTTFKTKEGNLSLFMPVSNTTTTGLKIITVANAGGLSGVINIFSPGGKLLGLIDAGEITAFRTALAIMTLFVRCPSLKKEKVVILGAGKQAEWHARLALLLASEDVKNITFVNRSGKRLKDLEESAITSIKAVYPAVNMAYISKDDNPNYDEQLEAAIGASDVIFSCTPATEPNFPFSFLSKSPRQRFISLIGSYKPHMQEIDSETLLSGGGKIYVDSKEACMEESGELIKAKVSNDQLIEIGELYKASGDSALDLSDGHNVVFKCVGMGIMDLAVGLKVLNIAQESGLGVDVDGF